MLCSEHIVLVFARYTDSAISFEPHSCAQRIASMLASGVWSPLIRHCLICPCIYHAGQLLKYTVKPGYKHRPKVCKSDGPQDDAVRKPYLCDARAVASTACKFSVQRSVTPDIEGDSSILPSFQDQIDPPGSPSHVSQHTHKLCFCDSASFRRSR